jgi:hypothetical protein
VDAALVLVVAPPDELLLELQAATSRPAAATAATPSRRLLALEDLSALMALLCGF